MKHMLKRVLASSGIVPSILNRRRGCYILMLHGVGDSHFSAASFARLLDTLGKHFRFRAMDELLAGRIDGEQPSIWLTFDDGLRNHLTCAYKFLQQRSVPATFYVCPELIETGSWLWTHEMRERLRSLEPERMGRLSLELLKTELGYEDTITLMKGLASPKRKELERRIQAATPDFRPDSAQRVAFDLMSWDELRQLDPGLITIGSHSMSHAMLDSVTPEEAEYEIVHSRHVLETKLDRQVVHFCYPAGQFGPMAESFVRATYRTATITLPALLDRNIPDPHRLPRLPASACAAQTMWSLLRSPQAPRIPNLASA